MLKCVCYYSSPAHTDKTPSLLIADENGIGAILSLAKQLKNTRAIVFLSAKKSFPFKPQPSKYLIPELPANLIASIPLLEDWGIANRLASHAATPGCYHGNAVELGAMYLSTQKSMSYPAIWLAGSQEIINNSNQLLTNLNVQAIITE